MVEVGGGREVWGENGRGDKVEVSRRVIAFRESELEVGEVSKWQR